MPVRLDDVRFAYEPGRPVLTGVSLALEPGRITAILGPNGSGKSTLLRLALGLLVPGAGAATIDDPPRPVHAIPYHLRARRLVYVPQRSGASFAFTVRQSVAMALPPGLNGAEAVDRALDQLDLADRAEDPLGTLSVGQQQRAALARALVQLSACHAPAVLIADEPLSAMDPRHAALAADLIARQADRGVAVAIVLHDLSLAARLAHRAALLTDRGRLAAEGPIEQVLTPEALAQLYGTIFLRAEALVPAPPSRTLPA